jgi:hypothetical protein
VAGRGEGRGRKGKIEGRWGTEIKRCKLYKEREKIERGRGR